MQEWSDETLDLLFSAAHPHLFKDFEPDGYPLSVNESVSISMIL
jgi:hypothetical protein